MKLSQLIAEARKKSGLSLQGVASATGMTKSHVWELENGRSCNPSLLNSARLCTCLNIPVMDMVSAVLEQAHEVTE